MILRTRVLTLSAVVAAAAGLSAPGLAAAATATAASGLITVTSAGSPAASVGDLSIGLEATSTVGPASITASLYAAGATTPALTVTGFTQTGGPAAGAGATTWTVATPIPAGSGPGELPLGSYRIEVTAADDGGDTTDDSDAGTLAYLVQPAITLTVSPATVSYGQQVTISGTDTGLYPDGSHQPVVGQEVDFITQPSATTNASGTFTFTVQAGIGQAWRGPGQRPGVRPCGRRRHHRRKLFSVPAGHYPAGPGAAHADADAERGPGRRAGHALRHRELRERAGLAAVDRD